MPFGEEDLQVIYEDYVRPTIEDVCKLRCERGDDVFGSNVIMDDIQNSIEQADRVVAALTRRNAHRSRPSYLRSRPHSVRWRTRAVALPTTGPEGTADKSVKDRTRGQNGPSRNIVLHASPFDLAKLGFRPHAAVHERARKHPQNR
jgi:hypothetical protein